MEIRHLRAEDVVMIVLSDRPQAGPAVEIHRGIVAARDAAGHLIRLEIHDAAEQIGLIPGAEESPADATTGVEDSPSATSVLSGAGQVTVYSDGGCLGNPGPGGWGTRLKYADGRILELGGREAHTTNNRMELTAAIEGLKRVQDCPSIIVVTDSEYLRKGITQWIHGWKRRGWITAARKPVLNQDLWQELDRLNRPDIQWRYTRGHAGDPDNERCDELAQAFARGRQPHLRTA